MVVVTYKRSDRAETGRETDQREREIKERHREKYRERESARARTRHAWPMVLSMMGSIVVKKFGISL
jgi:hypothetical protein